MPSAVPYQQGLIGEYNITLNPGVYVSWDANTSFNSVYSLIFKGLPGNNYLFPLLISQCIASGITTNIGTPIGLAAGTTYIYALTTNYLIVYQKFGDVFNTVATTPTANIQSNLVPTTLNVNTLSGVEYAIVGFSQGNFVIYTLNGGNLVQSNGLAYSSICGINTNYYNSYDLAMFSNKIYFSYLGNVYGGDCTLGIGNTLVLGSATTGSIINSTNGLALGNTINNISIYANDKMAVIDSSNIVYEFIYSGNPNTDNSIKQWSLSWQLTPNNSQKYVSTTYNHTGAVLALDANNHQMNVLSNGNIVITMGGYGYGYMQFNLPNSIIEDSSFNVIVGDLNNRLNYIPTQLQYVTQIPAPLTEYIDYKGNPAEVYYIKQSTYNYTQVGSLPPISADELLIKSSVLYELNSLLKVPVYDEEPLFGFNRQSATLAYGDIITDPSPQIRITVGTNEGQRSSMYVLSAYQGFYNSLDQSNNDPFDIPAINNNYPNGLLYRFTSEGKLYFFDVNGNPISVQEYDTILVTYYVKMFTNTQINNALYLALQAINAQPGTNKHHSPASVPFWYDQCLVCGATYYLLRQLLVGLNSRERRLLIQDPEQGSFDAIANLKETAKMYQEEFSELLKKIPLAVRPTMGTITVPEYAMPGGRSRMFRYMFSQGQT